MERNEIRSKYHQLQDENILLKEKILKEKEKNENLRIALLDALKELDKVGLIHGSGSKTRAKLMIRQAMQERFGTFWEFECKKKKQS